MQMRAITMSIYHKVNINVLMYFNVNVIMYYYYIYSIIICYNHTLLQCACTLSRGAHSNLQAYTCIGSKGMHIMIIVYI